MGGTLSGVLAALPDLPVRDALPDVLDALRSAGRAVLIAPPGAGKTTLVPLALLDGAAGGTGKIIVLEPRRLAARAAAQRIATLLGEPDAGGTVGYRMRSDTRVGPATRIEVVTEGVLTRMLLDDPALTGVGTVVFDEFHERSLHADVGLALTLQARELLRDDLRIVVMSATLDAQPVADLLGGAPVIRSEGQSHPVETRWRDRPVEGWIEPAVAHTVLAALADHDGDVLVFLPGAGEIRNTAERIRDGGLPPGADLHPLFGALPRGEQDRAIAPSPPGRRKVVLATSIAETSLTIEGVTVVVDSGRMRVPRFDPASGMTRLATVTVTRDAADQRRGRAGRTAPGVCYRMWTRAEDLGLVPTRRPEIEEADLTPLALELAVWGAAPGELCWMTPPPPPLLAQATELLRELEALDASGRATPHGRALVRMGAHPRLAHMLLRGHALGVGATACDLAALLLDRDLLESAGGPPPDADLRLRLDVLRRARESGTSRTGSVLGSRVHRGGLERALEEARRLRRTLPDASSALHATDSEQADSEQAGLLLAFAYPDRIARRRDGQRGRYLLQNGRGAELGDGSTLGDAEWLVAADLDLRGRDARVFRAAPLDVEDLMRHFGDQMSTVEEVGWSPATARVEARRRTTLGAITVSEGALPDPDPASVTRALLAGVRAEGVHALPWTREREQLRDRLVFLHALEPDRFPDRSDPALLDTLERWLAPFLGTPVPRTLAALARIDFDEALLSGVAWEDRARMDSWAPTHLEVPSGSRIAIDYSDPAAPALAVRLQELFGMTRTPQVGGGRVPLTLRLLSPAHRPVQVTRDLESFWRTTYFDVRKDLRGRYPKHAWPDDPLTAEPTRRTRKW